MSESPPAPPRPEPPPPGTAIITYLLICLCVAVWAYLNFATGLTGFKEVSRLLLPSSYAIWNGSIWGVVTSAFVHQNLWHLLLNLWLLHEFGSCLELTMGRVRYLLLVVASAAVGSGAYLAFAGQSSFGISGVVYALFGYLLAGRQVVPLYRQVASPLVIQIMLGCLVLCILVDALGLLRLANSAHLAGLLFGVALANVFVTRRWVTLSHASMAALTALMVLSVSYLPWSDNWKNREAAARFFAAVDRAEAGDPEAQTMYGSALVKVPGRETEGLEWLRKAAGKGHVPGMNALAWHLATSTNTTVRNGEQAVQWAEKACRKDDWKNPALIDTLAAAYAEVEKWDLAIATQARALGQLKEKPDPALGYERRLQQYLKHEKARE